MRTYVAATTALIWWCHAFVNAAAASDRQGRATDTYQDRVGKMAHSAIDAELFKHPERLVDVSMKMTYRIDRRGNIQDVKIISGHRDRWAEKTARRVLASLKLPPVPSEVLREMGMDHIDAQSTWTYYTSLPGPNHSLQLTAGRRETRHVTTSVHRRESNGDSASGGSAPSR